MRSLANARGRRERRRSARSVPPIDRRDPEELEQFVSTQLRLHLAIAERDRYVPSSIEVECDEADEHRELLRIRRRVQARQIAPSGQEVIAGLRNASAIDLSQFAGSTPQQTVPPTESRSATRICSPSLIAAPAQRRRPYRWMLLGRWSPRRALAAGERPCGARTAPTPLAAPALSIDIEDADGERRIELTSIVEGKRYAIGKGEGCDIVVNGVYASRRHCEMWFDKGGWWVVDAGSTNGIRVESVSGAIARSQQGPQGVPPSPPILLAPGAG
jgi:hypothetical protein